MYAYEIYSMQGLCPYVYIDGGSVGQGPVTVEVYEGSHTIQVDYYCGPFYLIGFSDGYGNGDSRSITSDTTIAAIYNLGG